MPDQNLKWNPYIAGKAIGSKDGFFGREDILHVVQDALSSGHQSAIVLAGQRRIGKTSILLQLQRRLPADLFCPVYFDLMDRAGESLDQVLTVLASTLAAEVDMALADFRADEDGAAFQRDFLPQLYAALGPARRPVLLLDEFDVLDSAAQRNLDPSSAALKLFPYLRRLMEQDGRLGFVFVVGRKVDELSIQFKAAFKAALFKKVSVLELEAARKLILTADRDGTLRFQPAAVDRILSLTSGHPLFTQLICQILWDSAHSESPATIPEVSEALVDSVVERALEAGENVFQWIWDGLPPAERIISAAIARATQEHKVVSEEELLTTLQGNGIRILTRELNVAPETLVDWEVLRRVDGGYEFFIELMREWVQNRKPLQKVKSELDRIVQPADELFRSADMIYRQGDHTGVEQLLKQVLRINPNHVNARLLLGECFLEEKRVVEAVAILEEAFQYDEDNARYPLVRALLQQGSAQENSGLVDQALESYERILKLSPKERNAGEHRNEILVRRGERCLEAGDLEGARTAFTMAGAKEKFELLEAAKRKQQLTELSQSLSGLLGAKEYEKAIPIIKELLSLDPENAEWKAQAITAEREASLQRNYAEGVGAFSTGDFSRAIRALAEVVHVRPDFMDAAARLAEAVDATRVAAQPVPPPPVADGSGVAAPAKGALWKKRLAWGFISLGGFILLILLITLLAGLSRNTGTNTTQTRATLPWEDKVTVHEQASALPVDEDFAVLHGGPGQAHAILVSLLPNSRFLLTGGDDGFVRMWDLGTRQTVFERNHGSPVRDLVASRDGSFFVTRADDNTLRIFRVVFFLTRSPRIKEESIPLEGPLGGLALSADGKTLATLQLAKHALVLLNADTGKEVGKTTYTKYGDDQGLDFSFGSLSDKDSNAIAMTNVRLDFFSVPGLVPLQYLDSVYATAVSSAPTAPVVALRAFGYNKQDRVAVWPVQQSAPEDVFQTVSAVNGLCFSRDSGQVALGTDQGLVVFDRATGKQVFRGPRVQVRSVDCQADSSMIAAGGTDGRALIFKRTNSRN